MATYQDCSVGIAKESTYGTGVTVTRWFEFLSETFDVSKNIVQGKGLRVGSTVARSARRVVPTRDAGGDFTMELTSKGMGLLWEQCMGTATSTLVAGTTYQQVFTFADVMPSATWQKGLPRTDGSTVDAYTFLGGQVDSFEVTFGNEIGQLACTVDARTVTTGTAYASPSYSSNPTLYHFGNAALYTGTLTAPTSTALASGNSELANVRSGSIKVSHNLHADRYNFSSTAGGLKSKPTVGERVITGSLVVEYDSATFRDAVLNETPMLLLVQYTGAALSTGNETLQIVVPEIKLDGKLPSANGGDLITVEIDFVGLDNLTAAKPLWVVARTADTAL